MKKKPSGRARISRQSRERFEPRLRAYSTLSGAAIVSALATAASDSAQGIVKITIGGSHPATDIVATSGTPPVGTGETTQFFEFELHNFSAASERLALQRTSTGLIVKGTATSHAPGPTRVNFADTGGTVRRALKLALNDPIAGAGQWVTRGVLFYNSANSGRFATHGAGTAAGYVGFRLAGGVHTYYGWLHVKVTGNGAGVPQTLDFVPDAGGVIGAYAVAGGVNGGNILAGEVSAIPEPATLATGLALFALGAVGVREHRRRKLAAVR